jgi:hypothetical protein
MIQVKKTKASLSDEDEQRSPRKKSKPSSDGNSSIECICGAVERAGNDKKGQCKCQKCGIVQHVKCVGFNPDTMGKNYYCPFCVLDQPKVKTKATLIVAPMAISSQWIKELEKLLVKDNSLKIKVYRYYFGSLIPSNFYCPFSQIFQF